MNKQIIDQFKLLLRQIQIDIDFTTGKEQMINTYRLQSIKSVIKTLEKFSTEITSSDQLKGIKTIGKGSLKRIDEILKTGKLSEIKISGKEDEYLELINKLEDIFGVGRKTAYDLFMHHNIKTIDELKKKYESGEIQLPENIVKGLKYLGQIQEKIPRSEIDDVETILMTTTIEIDYQLFGMVCGSYRRELPMSNDVDFIITHPKIKTQKDILNNNYLSKFVERLKMKNIIVDSFTSDDVLTKYMGIYKLKNGPLRRIDIRNIPYESFYSAILYFTGPKDFNRKMRQVAIDMGYFLNEYGLYDEKEKMFKVNSEKEIFDLLGMEYLMPSKRN